jgi:hypothetical protein
MTATESCDFPVKVLVAISMAYVIILSSCCCYCFDNLCDCK